MNVMLKLASLLEGGSASVPSRFLPLADSPRWKWGPLRKRGERAESGSCTRPDWCPCRVRRRHTETPGKEATGRWWQGLERHSCGPPEAGTESLRVAEGHLWIHRILGFRPPEPGEETFRRFKYLVCDSLSWRN